MYAHACGVPSPWNTLVLPSLLQLRIPCPSVSITCKDADSNPDNRSSDSWGCLTAWYQALCFADLIPVFSRQPACRWTLGKSFHIPGASVFFSVRWDKNNDCLAVQRHLADREGPSTIFNHELLHSFRHLAHICPYDPPRYPVRCLLELTLKARSRAQRA